MVVIVVLARRDNVHDLPLTFINALLRIHPFSRDDHMQLFCVFLLRRTSGSSIFYASLSPNGNLANVVLLQSLLCVSPRS